MPRGKKPTAQQIISKLRLELAKGCTAAQAAKKVGVTEQTYYRWRKDTTPRATSIRAYISCLAFLKDLARRSIPCRRSWQTG